jgi:chitin disaccharide deacetylase
MKYLIVNGDDFGASRGINRGVIEAHQRGILTSASLLVDGAASEEAAALARRTPTLSVGLHVDLRDGRDCRAELQRQFERFGQLMHDAPTHLDSHHDVHRDGRWLPCFREFAKMYGLRLRADPPIHTFSRFYGQWNGESHPEHISAANLARMLASAIEDGVTELSCHPGYIDAEFSSSYAVEREIELRSLCDPMPRHVLSEKSIQLLNHREAARLIEPYPGDGASCRSW